MIETLRSQYCITSTAANIARLQGIVPPEKAAEPNPVVLEAAMRAFSGRTADRTLIYNPDAVGLWLFQKYTGLFAPVQVRTGLTLPLTSVMPSVTPVCFASIYSGAMPEEHGIQAYVKPVLTIDTVFDALIRAGKKPAIVSTAGDSISRIFLEREMDYFIYDTVEEVNAKTMELIREDKYDHITVYNGNYDATMHRNAPEAEVSLAALSANSKMFAKLYDLAAECWAGHDSVIGYCPDHGCHEIDGGLGSHGLDMYEDMNVVHFYGFLPKK